MDKTNKMEGEGFHQLLFEKSGGSINKSEEIKKMRVQGDGWIINMEVVDTKNDY